MNRKASYIDFNKQDYDSLSDREVQLVKMAKVLQIKIFQCKKHGLVEYIYAKNYSPNGKEINRYGCIECLRGDGSNE